MSRTKLQRHFCWISTVLETEVWVCLLQNWIGQVNGIKCFHDDIEVPSGRSAESGSKFVLEVFMSGSYTQRFLWSSLELWFGTRLDMSCVVLTVLIKYIWQDRISACRKDYNPIFFLGILNCLSEEIQNAFHASGVIHRLQTIFSHCLVSRFKRVRTLLWYVLFYSLFESASPEWLKEGSFDRDVLDFIFQLQPSVQRPVDTCADYTRYPFINQEVTIDSQIKTEKLWMHQRKAEQYDLDWTVACSLTT